MPIINNMPNYRPYTNIQPFTVRDGATYLLQLEALKDWLHDYVIPTINTEVGGLTASWEEQTEALIENWEQLSVALIEQVSTIAEGVEADAATASAAKAAAEAARDLAEIFASEAQEVQDDALTIILNDIESDFRIALDALYAPLVGFNGLVDTVTEGRLSEATLDARFALKADATTVSALAGTVSDNAAATTAALAGKASVATQETVDSGRLSSAALDASYGAKSVQDAIVADVATIPRKGYGVVNATKKYRVVACTLRNNGGTNGWQPIDDSNHTPEGVSVVTQTATYIQLGFNFTGYRVVSCAVTTDETFAKAAVRLGASVALSFARIYIYSGAAYSDALNPQNVAGPGTASEAANIWVYLLLEVE